MSIPAGRLDRDAPMPRRVQPLHAGDPDTGPPPLARNPLFDEPLHVGAPNVGDRERFLARVNHLLDRRWLTNHGPYVREFEARIEEMLGVRHCVTVCNATVGLQIALRAAGLSGEVIVPSYTFVATAHALQWEGLTPVFCDVDPETHTLDPARVRALIGPRTSAILGVHLWGRAAAVEELQELAHAHGLRLIFDAAHAFGSSRAGRMIGNFGDAEVFSFHATKVLNTFEGGAIVTNDDQLAAHVRRATNFGFEGHDAVAALGTNAKLSEVAAAMGLTLLEDFGHLVDDNRTRYAHYARWLRGLPGIDLVRYDESDSPNYHYLVLEVDPEQAKISRDELVSLLWQQNVRARRYFYPGCHRMEPYRTMFPEAGLRLPVTERLGERVLALPTGRCLTARDIRRICRFIRTRVLERHTREAGAPVSVLAH